MKSKLLLFSVMEDVGRIVKANRKYQYKLLRRAKLLVWFKNMSFKLKKYAECLNLSLI